MLVLLTCVCLVTQCLSTLSTLMVETLLVMEHFRLAASRNSISLRMVGSGGLPEPAVATANATAAFAELDLGALEGCQ